MSKRHAFLIHLALSAAVVGAVCGVIFFVWYPGPYFAVRGAENVLLTLLGVDVVLGPLLTLYLYRPGKRGLKIDMTFIAVVQLVALTYGTWVLYTERPYYTVFAVDRFEVLSEHEVAASDIELPELRQKPLVGPVMAVAVRPQSQQEIQKLIDEVIFQGKPDIERRPWLWVPYSQRISEVVDKIQPFERLTDAYPENAFELEAAIEAFGREREEIGYVPLIGREKSFAFVLDRGSGYPLGIIDVDPWID